jgi:hypothetical protein
LLNIPAVFSGTKPGVSYLKEPPAKKRSELKVISDTAVNFFLVYGYPLFGLNPADAGSGIL